MSLSPNSNAPFDAAPGIAPSPNSYNPANMTTPGGYSSFNPSLDHNQLSSPHFQSSLFQHVPLAASTFNASASDAQSTTSAAPVHRTSVGSSNQFAQQLHSDSTSPVSIGGHGSLFAGENSHTGSAAANATSSQTGTDGPRDKDQKGDTMPSWAELKTKAGKERKRLPLACIACRRKKIRCSGEKPACKHCLRSRIPCVYKVTTRKAAPRTDYMAMLDKRLKRMEERVIKIVPKEDQARISTIGRAVVKPAIPGLPPKSANDKKRPADSAFAQELSDWSRSRTSVAPKSSEQAGTPAATAAAQAARNAADEQEESLLKEGLESLPPVELVRHLAEVYFDFVYGQGYHLLHKPSFMRRLEAGQVPPVLILAVCAVSARFSNHPDLRTQPAFLRGEHWASAAREIALKRYDAPNITILIVYLILGLHEFGTCQGGRSWMLGGMAQRMAYALQLHKDLAHDAQGKDRGASAELSFTDREIRRRTMWACFMMDRFNSSGTERPIFVNEQFIQSQLPIKEHYFQFEIPGVTENLENAPAEQTQTEEDDGESISARDNMGVAAYIVRLVAIWGQLIRYMNLGGRERDSHPMWSEESGFSRLRATIKGFQTSLPLSLSWTADNLQSHASEKIANQFIFLHIILNQHVLFLNRFALPSPGSRLVDLKDMPQAFVSECGRTALEAANQISILINEAMDHRVVAPFAGYCAYLASTVHIYGVFSKSPALEASSKQNLAVNVKYLTKMKKHWGMFHFVTENLKDLYRKHADAAIRGPQSTQGSTGSKQHETIFQYGDWFDRYPHGVTGMDYEEPITEIKKEPGADAVLGQRSDLQSVEEFFSKLGPPARSAARKTAKRKRAKSDTQTSQPADAEATSTDTASNATPQADGNTSSQQVPQQSDSMARLPSGSRVRNLQQQQPMHLNQHQHQLQDLQQQHQTHLQSQHQHIPSDNSSLSQQNLFASGGMTPNMSMLQAQQRAVQPAQRLAMMPPHSDRDGMPPPSPYTMSRAAVNFPTPGTNAAGGDNPNNPFDIDLNAYNFGVNATSGAGGLWDQSSAWFMPFNMDPPSQLPDDGGLFSGTSDVNGFDMGIFGDFAGMSAMDGNMPGAPPPPDGHDYNSQDG